MLITSVNNERIRELVKLKDKKYRDKIGLFFVEGLDIVKEAYENGVLEHIYILEGYDNPYEDIDTTNISIEVMKKISDMESISGYYGVCRKIKERELGNKILLLDNLQDPGNLGTIIRSGVAFNFDTIVLSNDSVDLYNPKVIRSTKGMLFKINIVNRDLKKFILENDDYLIYGTDVIKGINVREIDKDKKIGIVIGNEGKGMSLGVKELCNKFIYIPINGKCESLNAGVAASIIMYEVNNR